MLRTRFETAFVRGERLRFESHDEKITRRSVVVWFDGNHTFSSGSRQPRIVDDGRDIGFALEAAHAESSGSSTVVPRLLLPSLGSSNAQLRDPYIGGAEMVDGQKCWHLVGTSPRGNRIELWIDQSSHLLRRTQSWQTRHAVGQYAFGQYAVAVTTSYDPRVNAPVAEALLQPPDLSAGYEKRDQPGFIGLSFDRDSARVLEVAAGGPAERAGLLVGDEIVSIEDEAVATGRDIAAKTRALVIDAGAKFVVRRDGTELTLTVVPQPWSAPDFTAERATPTRDEP